MSKSVSLPHLASFSLTHTHILSLSLFAVTIFTCLFPLHPGRVRVRTRANLQGALSFEWFTHGLNRREQFIANQTRTKQAIMDIQTDQSAERS